MALIREHYENRSEWLKARHYGIGASDAAAILGLSPWRSNVQLWIEKTGVPKAEDSVKNTAVQLGNVLENPVREVFRAKHPELNLEYYPFDILYQDSLPWLRATLDGEITEMETGRRGIYEGKTATCMKKADWAKWSTGIPEYYLTQCIWQLKATDYDFVYLTAFLMNPERDKCEYREYLLEKADCIEDMEYITAEGVKFWRYVENKKMPPMIIG